MTDESSADQKIQLLPNIEPTNSDAIWDDTPVWGRMREVSLGNAGILREVCIDAGARTSLHFHNHTREINVVAGGTIRMRFGPTPDELEDVVLDKDDIFVSEPGMYHVALFESAESPERPWARIVEMILNKPDGDDDAIRIAPGEAGANLPL